MKKVLKSVGIVLGALVLGGFMGWCFDQLGFQTPVSVAVILAICVACSQMIKRKKEVES